MKKPEERQTGSNESEDASDMVKVNISQLVCNKTCPGDIYRQNLSAKSLSVSLDFCQFRIGLVNDVKHPPDQYGAFFPCGAWENDRIHLRIMLIITIDMELYPSVFVVQLAAYFVSNFPFATFKVKDLRTVHAHQVFPIFVEIDRNPILQADLQAFIFKPSNLESLRLHRQNRHTSYYVTNIAWTYYKQPFYACQPIRPFQQRSFL